jgi:GntR family galactonate operon transcriptional repressor
MSADSTRRERRHEVIVREFVGQIASGAIPVGTRLPYESEIMARYAVSRTVARDAVQRIVGFGLVEVRRHSGAIVLPSERWNMLEPIVLDAFMHGKPTAAFFSGLFEARLMVESEAAALAAMRIDAAAISEMAAALEVMRSAPERDAFIDADMRFHAIILDATGNWVLRQFAGALHAALRAGMYLSRESSSSTVIDRSIDMHADLLSAIRSGDAVRSRLAMIWLLTEVRVNVEAALKEAALKEDVLPKGRGALEQGVPGGKRPVSGGKGTAVLFSPKKKHHKNNASHSQHLDFGAGLRFSLISGVRQRYGAMR